MQYLEQVEIFENNQKIFLYTFLIDVIPNSLENFIEQFIHSSDFKNYCLPNAIKKEIDKRNLYLKRAVNEDSIEITDFKSLKQDELREFFKRYSQSEDWGEDRNDFINLMNKFFEYIKAQSTNVFFLLSKEWFNKDDSILNNDSHIYIYYFLVIWIEGDKKVLNVCEWNYD